MEAINKRILIAGLALAGSAGFLLVAFLAFSPPNPQSTEAELFTVALKTTEPEIVDKLHSQGFIRNPWAFNLALTIKGRHNRIEPGGYLLSKNMTAWQVAKKLSTTPDMKWVVIPEGLRKEQIGEILAKTFNWSSDDLAKWNTTYTAMTFDYFEGVYFPDTYLIPTKETGLEIANRMINRFNEKFSPYLDQFAQQDILWTTGLKLASVLQREAGGKADMPLIAGILWNRLLQEMKLDVDATVQYARGKTDQGWWAPIKPADITGLDSPYNTYKYKGLPPHPICNPGLDAIEAVLNPTATDCLFYLHDSTKQIHCAKTYEEHLANIEQYLK
ncbi:MAG: endolytic transglycosylase MltG [bacterium]|nr:endolytic transglycosylase MltG [bacterium]